MLVRGLTQLAVALHPTTATKARQYSQEIFSNKTVTFPKTHIIQVF
jgi:hypothetical protein